LQINQAHWEVAGRKAGKTVHESTSDTEGNDVS